LHVHGRGAKTDACSRSFAVLSMQVSTAGLRLRHNRLTCGSMLEVSRDAVAAGEEHHVCCAAEQSKYSFFCTPTLDPSGDVPFTSWGLLVVSSRRRWRCSRFEIVVMPSAVAAKYRSGALPG
jgi:hypothetical protein